MKFNLRIVHVTLSELKLAGTIKMYNRIVCSYISSTVFMESFSQINDNGFDQSLQEKPSC